VEVMKPSPLVYRVNSKLDNNNKSRKEKEDPFG